MRRWMALFTALMILLTAGTAAGEGTATAEGEGTVSIAQEGTGTPDLYDLYDVTAQGRTWLGTAVPVLENVQIASAAILPENPEHLVVWDGTQDLVVYAALGTGENKILVLVESDEVTGVIPEYGMLDPGASLDTGSLMVRSGDRLGSRINREVYDAAPITWQGMDALLLTLSGDTAAGAAVLTADRQVAGIIAAEYAEGENRYIALTVNEITRCLMEASGALEAQDTAPEGYTVSMERNLVTFDWSAAETPEVTEGQTLFHVVADVDSDYLTYMEVGPDDIGTRMLLTPGRRYISGFVVCEKGTVPAELPEQYAWTELPEAEPLTDHAFRSEIFAIGDLATDAPATALPAAAEEITEEFLRSGRACIWSVTSYDVEEEMDGLSLLVTLTTPGGSNFRWESGWVYSPDYEQRDEWFTRMDESGLLDMLNYEGYETGEYVMDMYIDGELADSFRFTLE